MSFNVLMTLVIGQVHRWHETTVSVGGLSSSGGRVIKRQLSLTAMSNDCMEFMQLQPHARMPDDDTTSDYRYDLLDRISVYNADYVNKTSVCIYYIRSHLITADASSSYIVRCDPCGFYLTPQKRQNTLL